MRRMPQPLGRTNETYPPVWLRLEMPALPEQDSVAEMVGAAVASGCPLDVSVGTSIWGPHLVAHQPVLLARSTFEIEHAQDRNHAFDLVSAHLIMTLSSLTRPMLDFYCLRVRRAVEEFQLDGALEALETARQDGLVRMVGFAPQGSSLAAMSLWQFHDAFDIVLVPSSDAVTAETLVPLAQSRRVGVVWDGGEPRVDQAAIVTVKSAQDVARYTEGV